MTFDIAIYSPHRGVENYKVDKCFARPSFKFVSMEYILACIFFYCETIPELTTAELILCRLLLLFSLCVHFHHFPYRVYLS